jgi:hypothetical protein
MLEPNQPIYPRNKTVVGNVRTTVQPKPQISQEHLERKMLQHDDDWLHERKGRIVTVKFMDGEELTGIVTNIRKFHFSISMENGESVLAYKVGIKYVVADEAGK